MIELAALVALLAIFAAIALPNYSSHLRKSRREDMKQAILQIALAEERFRADCPEYANAFGRVCPATALHAAPLTFPSNPYSGAYYATPTLTPNAAQTGFKISATAKAGQNQDRQSGVSCATLVYDDGYTAAGAVRKTPAPCWGISE